MRFVFETLIGNFRVEQVDKIRLTFPSGFVNRVAEEFQGVGIVEIFQRRMNRQDEGDRSSTVIKAELKVIFKNCFFYLAGNRRILIRNHIGRQTDENKFYRAGLDMRENMFSNQITLLQCLIVVGKYTLPPCIFSSA